MESEFRNTQMLQIPRAEVVVIKSEVINGVDGERLEVWADGICVFTIEHITGNLEMFVSEIRQLKFQ